jgi:hypothetical protein
MFRRIANLLMSLPLVATLLLGGCVACPQCFQVPQAKKSCCDSAGRCSRTKTNCSQQGSSRFQQLKLQQRAKPPVPLVAAIYPVLPSTSGLLQLRQVIRGGQVRLGSLPESPHSRQVLLSTFLI